MDNMEAFHLTSTNQEPECTFLTLNLMRRARDMAFNHCCTEPRAYKDKDVCEAITVVFPDVWRAWREWAGPGSDTCLFDRFKPARFAAHRAYERLNLKMVESGGEFRYAYTVDEMAAQMQEDEPESYPRWIAEDQFAVRHSIERLAAMNVFIFDGEKVQANDVTWTIDYLQNIQAAWEWEMGRMNADLEQSRRHLAMLEESGCETLGELEAQAKH
ncbi:hypothetical protein [Paraburkholderia flagellata]|uniref:hypothetical protein n=1 Tax=Paraburkholderia flagellata TaxID=2883241 RepID=UPI001F356150|nr:hypothetical protein [Paraburkholderia flagellata]